MSPINHELQLANDFVQHTGCNIFLTGKAGTGKTTFLHNLHKNTVKRMIITAPTGVAAINAGGVTLHSFFQLPFGPFVQRDAHDFMRFSFNEKYNLNIPAPQPLSAVCCIPWYMEYFPGKHTSFST